MTVPLWSRPGSSASLARKPSRIARGLMVAVVLAIFGVLAYAAAESLGVVKPLFAHHAAWRSNDGPH